jgi:hypothetical protein
MILPISSSRGLQILASALLAVAVAATVLQTASAERPRPGPQSNIGPVSPTTGLSSTSPNGAAAINQYVEGVPGAAGNTSGGGPATYQPAAGGGASSNSAVGAALNAVASGDEAHVIGLGAALFLITSAFIFAAARHDRPRGQWTHPDASGTGDHRGPQADTPGRDR